MSQDEARRQGEGMETLIRLTRTIAAAVEPEVTLPAVADAARSLVPDGVCRLWTVEGERLELRAESGAGTPGGRSDLRAGEGLLGGVVASGQPAVVEDLGRCADLAAAERSLGQGFASAAALPLLVADRVAGVLALFSRAPRAFTPVELKVLEACAVQAAAALSKARLFQDIQDRRRLTEDLYALTVAMTRSMDVQHCVDTFVQRAREALGFDRISVLVATDTGSALELVASTDLGPGVRRLIPLGAGGGACQAVWGSGETLIVSSDADLERLPPLEPELRDHPVFRARRFAVVPLKLQARSMGVVAADNKPSRRPITRRGVAHLELFCQQLASSINTARLFAAAQKNVAQAALLNEAARTLHRTLDVRRLLPEALASLGQTFGAAGAAVVLFHEPSAPRGTVIPWGSLDEEAARALAEPLRRREAPLLVPDAAARPGLLVPGLPEAASRGVAAFPVRGRSRVLGGLTLLFPAARELSEAEARLLAAYADQLAMALDNAALFEEAENKKTQLEQVFASTSDGFLVLDLEGRVVAFNRQGGDLLGLVPQEVVGRPFGRLVDMLARSVAWEDKGGQALAAAVERRSQPAAGDLELRLPEHRTLRWQTTPTRDLLGAAVGVTVTLRDVTREREIDRMKTEFVSTVSHELRTPLTSIKGSLHLLLSDPALVLDETQRSLIDISLTNTDRLIRLISDILDISKIEAGRMKLELGAHRPAAFVTMAVEGIRGFAESRGIVLAQQLADELPELRVDFDRMVQVVTNLLSNAIKFSPAGGRVTVGARLAGDEVELWVADEGRGIAPEDLGRLFRKFQQLDGSMVREVGGTGLGLAICRGIVEEHGGRIDAESRPGAGATFTVTLPVPRTEGAALRAPGAGEPGGGGPLILVVDDEPNLRMLLRDQLEMEGFRVVEAGRALEAVELARGRRPDIITMDVMLPDLDGFEAIRLLRQHPETRETPVVILSAVEVEPGDTRTLGATACLTKPFPASLLLKTIRTSLRAGKGIAP